MMVRAKFVCQEVAQFIGPQRKVRLTAATSGVSDEDKLFWKYTPSGELTMHIDNPPASDIFVPGRAYYLDFTPA